MIAIQTDCEFNINGFCNIATSCSSIDCNIYNKDICIACKKQDNPKSINRITIELGILKLYNSNKRRESLKLRSKYIEFFIGKGPGTNLIKILEYLKIHGDNDCGCEGYAKHMNEKGSELCRKEINIIVAHLHEKSVERGWKYFPNSLAKKSVLLACDIDEGLTFDKALKLISLW